MARRPRTRNTDDEVTIETEVTASMTVLFMSLYLETVFREMPTAAAAALEFDKRIGRYASQIRVRANTNDTASTIYHHIRWAQTHAFISSELMVRLYKQATGASMWASTDGRHQLKSVLTTCTAQILSTGIHLSDVVDLLNQKPTNDGTWQDVLRINRAFTAASVRRLTHDWSMFAWPHDCGAKAWNTHWFQYPLAVIESGEVRIKRTERVVSQ